MKRLVWLSIFLVSLISLKPLISPKSLFAAATVRFLYDGDGVRVAKIEEGKTTLYIGDLEKDLSTGQVTKYYGLGGKRIAIKEGSNLSFLVSDHLGSLRTLSDLSGTKKANLSYYPYGSIRTKTGIPPSRQYTSQINDSSTGLYFYNARYYDPKNGLFISPDVIATNKTEGGSLNRFAYTQGNPIRFTDDTGRDIPCSFFGNCDRIKQLVAGGGATSCGNGDIGCQARHKFFSLVYQIPFIGPELVKNELTVDEKINAESASLIPGPAAMTLSSPLGSSKPLNDFAQRLRVIMDRMVSKTENPIMRAEYAQEAVALSVDEASLTVRGGKYVFGHLGFGGSIEPIIPGFPFSEVTNEPFAPFLKNILIPRELRRQGFGREIVQAWETTMAKAGFGTSFITNVRDEAALAFWKELGYLIPQSQSHETVPYYMYKKLLE